VHALVTAGLVDRDGEFTPVDPPPSEVAEELFRRRVLEMLVRRGKLEEDTAAGLLAWQHSGFSVHHQVRVEPWDAAGIERLARYLVHPPIALERLHVPGAQAPCTYRGSRPHGRTGLASSGVTFAPPANARATVGSERADRRRTRDDPSAAGLVQRGVP